MSEATMSEELEEQRPRRESRAERLTSSVHKLAADAAIWIYPVHSAVRALFSVAGMYLDLAVLARWLQLEAETGQHFYRTWFTVGICIFMVHFLVKSLNAYCCTVYASCFEVFGLNRRTRGALALRMVVTAFNLEYALQSFMTLRLWREGMKFRAAMSLDSISVPAPVPLAAEKADVGRLDAQGGRRNAESSPAPASKQWREKENSIREGAEGAEGGGRGEPAAEALAAAAALAPARAAPSLPVDDDTAGTSPQQQEGRSAAASAHTDATGSGRTAAQQPAFFVSSVSGNRVRAGITWQRDLEREFTMLNESFGLMRGVDAVVKSAPQAILQVYVMLVTRGFTYLNMTAIAFALLSTVFMFMECTYSTICGYGHFNVRPSARFSPAWFGSAFIAFGLLCSRVAVFAMLATVADRILPLGILVILSAFVIALVLRSFCFDFLSVRELDLMISVQVKQDALVECMSTPFLRTQARIYMVFAYSAANWIVAIPAVVAGDTWKWRNRTVAPVLHFFCRFGESLGLWLILLFSTYVSGSRHRGMWPSTTPPCPAEGPFFSEPGCMGCCRGPVVRREALTIFCITHVFIICGYLLWWPSQRRYFARIPDIGSGEPETPGQGLTQLAYNQESGRPISWRPIPPAEFELFRMRAAPDLQSSRFCAYIVGTSVADFFAGLLLGAARSTKGFGHFREPPPPPPVRESQVAPMPVVWSNATKRSSFQRDAGDQSFRGDSAACTGTGGSGSGSGSGEDPSTTQRSTTQKGGNGGQRLPATSAKAMN